MKLLCVTLPIFSISAWVVAVLAATYLSRWNTLTFSHIDQMARCDTLSFSHIDQTMTLSPLSEERLETRLVIFGARWVKYLFSSTILKY